MTAYSKNLYINKVCSIVDDSSNTYLRTIKMKHNDVENNDKDPTFKVGGLVRIIICRNIFGEGYSKNWSDEFFCR